MDKTDLDGVAGQLPSPPKVVVAPDEIDVATAPDLALSLAGHIQPTVVVDLTETRFCDCSALSVLILAAQRAEEAGGELRLAISSADVLKIFEITGLNIRFRIFSSVIAAIAAHPADWV